MLVDVHERTIEDAPTLARAVSDRHFGIGADGLIYIDTGTTEEGPPPGEETIDEPPTGPSCAQESHG